MEVFPQGIVSLTLKVLRAQPTATPVDTTRAERSTCGSEKEVAAG